MNLDELNARITALVQREGLEERVSKWFSSVFKKWMVNDGPTTKAKVTEDAPKWAREARDRGDDLVNLVFEANQWEHVLPGLMDYMVANPDQIVDFQRVSYPDMLSKNQAWHDRLKAEMKKNANKEFDEDRIEEYRSYLDGFKWVKVIGPKSLEREGKIMGHCVGSYAEQVKEENVFIYSLRDEDNRPHVTVEVTKKLEVRQVKGKANDTVVQRYVPYVEDFLMNREPEWPRIAQDRCPTTPALRDFFVERQKSAVDEKGRKVAGSARRPSRAFYTDTLNSIRRLDIPDAKKIAALFNKTKDVNDLKYSMRSIASISGSSYMLYTALYGLSLAYKKFPRTVCRVLLSSATLTKTFKTLLLAPWTIGGSTARKNDIRGGEGSESRDDVCRELKAEFKKLGISGISQLDMRHVACLVLRNEVARIKFTKTDLKFRGAQAGALKMITERYDELRAATPVEPKDLFSNPKVVKLLGKSLKGQKRAKVAAPVAETTPKRRRRIIDVRVAAHAGASLYEGTQYRTRFPDGTYFATLENVVDMEVRDQLRYVPKHMQGNRILIQGQLEHYDPTGAECNFPKYDHPVWYKIDHVAPSPFNDRDLILTMYVNVDHRPEYRPQRRRPPR
jgi:hypothetical protein